MAKFTDEELEGLYEITTHYGYKGFLKLIDGLARSQERDVLNYNLSGGSAERLAQLHSQAIGAKKLHKNLTEFLEKLRTSGSGVRR